LDTWKLGTRISKETSADLVAHTALIEVRAGLVSNPKSAQHWTAPEIKSGKAEKAYMKTLSREAKADFVRLKRAVTLRRKRAALSHLSRRLGRPIQPMTIASIINPDTQESDIFEFNGFYLRIGWNSRRAQRAYKGTYRYE
jgi:hypothetical protein